MNFTYNKKTKYISQLFLATVLFLNAGNTYAVDIACIDISKNLRVGMRDTAQSSEVYSLQNFLFSRNYLKVSPTGYFGRITEKAVKDFQYNENIYSSGFVGTITRSKITSLTCKTKSENTEVVQSATSTPTYTATSTAVKTELPYKSTDFTEWTTVWGDSSTTTSNLLMLYAGKATNGAQSLLQNTQHWKNYKLLTNVHVGQASISLITRYVDENNFIGCTFAGRYIEIIQKINGNTEVVAFTTVSDYPHSRFFNDDINLSTRVDGKTVGCTLVGNSDNVSFNNINDKLTSGGVGIQIWDTATGIANIKVKSVQIEQI